jgi:hypothetical protein
VGAGVTGASAKEPGNRPDSVSWHQGEEEVPSTSVNACPATPGSTRTALHEWIDLSVLLFDAPVCAASSSSSEVVTPLYTPWMTFRVIETGSM